MFRYYGLRSASAYILVFDVNLPETFQYVKNMREQILQSRSKEVPILIVGNKHDLGKQAYPASHELLYVLV